MSLFSFHYFLWFDVIDWHKPIDRRNNFTVIPTMQVSLVSKGSSRYASTQTRQHGLDYQDWFWLLIILRLNKTNSLKVDAKGENKFVEGMLIKLDFLSVFGLDRRWTRTKY